MRLNLTDIISTFDQYIGLGKYGEEYEDGAEVNINTDVPNPPKEAELTESMKNDFKRLLTEDCKNKKESRLDHPDSNVMSFDRFIKEQKGTPSNVASYFGALDDEDDDFEEE